MQPNDDAFCHRRAFLFMGLSVLPFLNLKAKAAQNLELENPARAQELDQISETHGGASSNPFITLSSGIGILTSGVLGAFYALAQKQKSANLATIESMTTKLVEKEAAIVSMQKNFESKLQNEKEERNEQIKKIDRLTVNLKKASDDKEELNMQLKDKLFSIEVMQERINLLNNEIKDKEDNLANVGSALAAKESEFKKLSSMYEETLAELTGSKSEIEGLRQDILKLEKELESKSSRIDDLNAEEQNMVHLIRFGKDTLTLNQTRDHIYLLLLRVDLQTLFMKIIVHYFQLLVIENHGRFLAYRLTFAQGYDCY
uniref:MAR-binding filament-like protein 1-1 n=1 Tax=Tanacetum cinerariifolium TaxID=118510 RepID=A0A6L2LSJ6_TANCI|nr:hypothetical protein [Tanacetum cinerariifolium]